MSPRHSWSAFALAALGSLVALPSHAQSSPPAPSHSSEPADPRLARGFQGLVRPTGIAELGLGWLTLPGASVCAERSLGNCNKGDTSFEVDAWQLYRANKRFAFGAGLLLGLIPTTDAPQKDSQKGANDVERSHSRSYLTLEATIRHYPYVGESVELWWGVAGGLAVVSDKFVVSDKNSDLALVGSRGVTIRTEGASIGLAGGAVFWLADHWSLGTTFRYGNWFLPKTAAKDPLTDEASLTGRNTMFSLGISIAYRIPL
ncbi:MAG: hypothetical protein ABUL62_20550 [Myxococcales bacterium]